MTQSWIVFLIVAVAAVFVVRQLFVKKKSNSCCDKGCSLDQRNGDSLRKEENVSK